MPETQLLSRILTKPSKLTAETLRVEENNPVAAIERVA